MKAKVFIVSLVIVLLTAFSVNAQKANTKTVCFKSNMHCAECENTLFEHLRFEKGVKDLKVDHVSNTILIVFTEGKTSEEVLVKSVEEKGYKAEKITEEVYRGLVEAVKAGNKKD